jgi:hypothetical protein
MPWLLMRACSEVRLACEMPLTMHTNLIPTSTKYYAYFWQLTECALRTKKGWPDYPNSRKWSDFDAFGQIQKIWGASEPFGVKHNHVKKQFLKMLSTLGTLTNIYWVYPCLFFNCKVFLEWFCFTPNDVCSPPMLYFTPNDVCSPPMLYY